MLPVKCIRIIVHLFVLYGCLFYFVPAPQVYAAEERLAIEIDPADRVFEVANMKPGDWAPRKIMIQNTGNVDFSYEAEAYRASGSQKLFDALVLEVRAQETILYDGKLKDFRNSVSRELPQNKGEELEFTIRFPYELGNDYQGLDVHFKLQFLAEDRSGAKAEETTHGAISSGGKGGAGGILPDTAAGMFTLIFLGFLILSAGTVMLLLQRRKLA